MKVTHLLLALVIIACSVAPAARIVQQGLGRAMAQLDQVAHR